MEKIIENLKNFEEYKSYQRVDIEKDSKLICNNKGRVVIISGDEARSADAYPGDIFHITEITEHWIHGVLIPKWGVFKRDAGLSGKNQDTLDMKPIYRGIIYGIRSKQMSEKSDDFWATFSIKK